MRPLRALLVGALLTGGLATSAASVAAQGAEPAPPRVVVEPMPDATPGSVWVSVRALPAGTPVVIEWGDGWSNTVTSRCTDGQAQRGDRNCRVRVRHAYDRDGEFTVTATWGAVPLASAPVSASRSVPRDSTAWRREMLRAVNALRAEAGVRPLRGCPRLTRSAQAYASTMANRDHFAHEGPDGTNVWQREAAAGYRGAVAAENLGAGQRTVREVMAAWRASASHYGALVDARYTHIGLGYTAAFHATYPTYWAQHLGRGGECG